MRSLNEKFNKGVLALALAATILGSIATVWTPFSYAATCSAGGQTCTGDCCEAHEGGCSAGPCPVKENES
jgi:hypothetical protein